MYEPGRCAAFAGGAPLAADPTGRNSTCAGGSPSSSSQPSRKRPRSHSTHADTDDEDGGGATDDEVVDYASEPLRGLMERERHEPLGDRHDEEEPRGRRRLLIDEMEVAGDQSANTAAAAAAAPAPAVKSKGGADDEADGGGGRTEHWLVALLLSAHDPHVICLQETWCTADEEDEVRRQLLAILERADSLRASGICGAAASAASAASSSSSSRPLQAAAAPVVGALRGNSGRLRRAGGASAKGVATRHGHSFAHSDQ